MHPAKQKKLEKAFILHFLHNSTMVIFRGKLTQFWHRHFLHSYCSHISCFLGRFLWQNWRSFDIVRHFLHNYSSHFSCFLACFLWLTPGARRTPPFSAVDHCNVWSVLFPSRSWTSWGDLEEGSLLGGSQMRRLLQMIQYCWGWSQPKLLQKAQFDKSLCFVQLSNVIECFFRNCSCFANFENKIIDITTSTASVQPTGFYCFAYKVKILMILMYPNSSLIGK